LLNSWNETVNLKFSRFISTESSKSSGSASNINNRVDRYDNPAECIKVVEKGESLISLGLFIVGKGDEKGRDD
jgi:hypothetical protein